MPWIPHPGPQTEFLSRGEFEVLFGGAAGPGKTDCLIAAATRQVMVPGYRGIIFRRTFPQLQEIMDRAWQHYPSLGGEYKATEKRWYFPAGAVGQKPWIAFGHMQHEDNKYDHQGKEYGFVGFDELTQFLESQYTYLFSRARSTDPNVNAQIRSTTNPGGIGHGWVKGRFVDIATPTKTHIDPLTGLSRAFIPAQIYDNPTLVENDPGYLARLEAMPEIERKRLLYGDWEVFSGQIFTELSQQTHGIEPFIPPAEWFHFASIDWGYAKPYSIGWYAVDYDGILYRYAELYGCKEGEPDVGLKQVAYRVAEEALEKEREMRVAPRFRVADPSIFSNIGTSRKREVQGGSVAEDFFAAGLRCSKADNDRIQGKLQCHKRLALQDDIDLSTGEIMNQYPMVRVANDCKHWWRTVPMLQSDERNVEDVDSDMEDHAYDEWRYACMARPMRPKKVVSLPRGTFAAERNRLIKARRVARARGISLEEAYHRTR